MDIGRAGPNKHSQAELSPSRVSASLLFSSEALKRNRRDDELTEDRLNQLQAPPPPPYGPPRALLTYHMMNSPRPFTLFATLLLLCIIVNPN